MNYSWRIAERELTSKTIETIDFRVDSIELELSPERSLEFSDPAIAHNARRISSIVMTWRAVPGGSNRSDAAESISSALGFARSIGAETLIVPFELLLNGKPDRDDSLHFVASRLLDLRFEAQRRAIVLACEVSTPFLMAALEAREFFDRVTSPFVGASVNPARFACDQDAADYVTEMTHRVAHVHLSLDAAHDVDVARWTDLLTAIRYRGPFSLSGECEKYFGLAKSLSTSIAYNSGKA